VQGRVPCDHAPLEPLDRPRLSIGLEDEVDEEMRAQEGQQQAGRLRR